MLLRVVRPMKRRESSKHYFRQRIPLDVLEKARGLTLSIPLGEKSVKRKVAPKAVELKISLQTSDPSEAKTRQANIAAYLEGIWKALRQGPERLTTKQVVALSGELYHIFVEAMEDDPGAPALWRKVRADNEAAQRGEFSANQLMIGPEKINKSLENRFGPFADVILAKRGLVVDEESRGRLLKHAAKAMTEAAIKIEKFADGDYSDNGEGKRFPRWEDKKKATTSNAPLVSLKGLLDGWWRDAKLNDKTESALDSYKRTIKYFTDFVGHDDAILVTPEDILAFKEHRLHTPNPKTGRTVSPGTFKNSDLAALKSIFNWGLSNRKIDSNPAQGITLQVGKKPRTRPKYFKLEERKAILGLSRDYESQGREASKLSSAKRWIPWICAYTGARVGEIAQLRKQDIFKEEGHWIFFITPDAGTVKNKEARNVPIHDHLIDQGFLEFVSGADDGYLFIDVKLGAKPRGKVRTLKNDLAEFVRTVVPDPDIAPNHGWRHTFKTLYREVDGYDPKVLDDMVGHASRTNGEGYGGSTIKTLAAAMKRFPWLLS